MLSALVFGDQSMSGTYMAISAVGVGFLIMVYLLVAPQPDKKKQPPPQQQKSKKKSNGA